MNTRSRLKLTSIVSAFLVAGFFNTCQAAVSPTAPAVQPQAPKIEDVTKKPVKKRLLPIIYSVKNGDKKLCFYFVPIEKRGKPDLGAVGAKCKDAKEATTNAELKAILTVANKYTPTYKEIVAKKQKEKQRRAKVARLASQKKKSVASVEPSIRFTADDDVVTGQDSNAGQQGDADSSAGNEDLSGLKEKLDKELDELSESSDSEDSEVYDKVFDSIFETSNQLKSKAGAKGDAEDVKALDALEDELISAESAEATAGQDVEAVPVEEDDTGEE